MTNETDKRRLRRYGYKKRGSGRLLKAFDNWIFAKRNTKGRPLTTQDHNTKEGVEMFGANG